MCAAADKRLLWHEVATDLLLSSLPSLLKGHYKRRQDLQEAGEEKKVTPPSWTSPCFGNAEREKEEEKRPHSSAVLVLSPKPRRVESGACPRFPNCSLHYYPRRLEERLLLAKELAGDLHKDISSVLTKKISDFQK